MNIIKTITNHFRKPEIIAVLCTYNEELNIDGCIRHIEPFVDKIILFDDASTDDTTAIAKRHKKVKKIILNKNKTKWDERSNRAIVLKTAYAQSKKKNSWVLCIDADERFESSFLKRIKKIAKNYSKTPNTIGVHFRELWDSIDYYRKDGIWGSKKKVIFFPLSPRMTFNYQSEHHIPWHYKEIDEKEILLDYNLYHLKMIKESDREKRKKMYNQLDPKKKMQPIGYDYLTDTKNIKLEKIPSNKEYDHSTVPEYYKTN